MVVISQQNLQKIIDIISQGAVVAIPTDTIYGLVCSFDNDTAINKIYQLKNRDYEKPFAILVKDWEQAQEFGIFDRNLISYLTNNFTPGQVTVVVKRQEWLSKFPYWKSKATIAIRVTTSSFVCQLITELGPLIATSFNLSTQTPINEWQNAQTMPIDYFVKTDHQMSNKASTVYDSINKKIIRE